MRLEKFDNASTQSRALKKRSRPSDDEIRAKLMARKQTNAPKKDVAEISKGSKVKEKIEIKNEMGDLHKNNPNDPNTLDRVKDALDMSLVSFNPKEREVLEQILNKSNQ
jgi:hypothetical protein